jgi:hypothetical protein
MSAAPQFSSPGPEDQEPEVGHLLATRPSDAPQLPARLQAASIAAATAAKAAVEARFAIAQVNRRDMAEVHQTIMELCDNPYFADEALYSKPLGDAAIEGLSIRFIEAYVGVAGNFHCASTVTWDDDEKRTVTVEVTDLERNNTIPVDVVVEKYVERRKPEGREVLGSRENKNKQTVYRVRAYEDEILMKQNNMVSKAFRTGVERLIPPHIKAEAIARIKATIRDAAQKDMPGSVKKLVDAYQKAGVPRDHLEAYLGHRITDTTVEEYESLLGLLRSIKEGQATWESVAKKPMGKPQRRGTVPVKSGDYEASKKRQPIPAEEIDMASKPKAGKPAAEGYKLDPEPTEDEERQFDRELVEREGRE